VLYDDNKYINELEQIYPNSELKHFIKPCENIFLNNNNTRDIDFCFCARSDQKTKNHSIFIEFINYLEIKRYKTKFIYIGNRHDNIELDNLINKQLKYVSIESYDWVDRMELIKLYNRSKINILFSGRDANPRAITESLYCGCYNVAISTLTDGMYQYIDNLGEIIQCNDVIKTASNSICPVLLQKDYKYMYGLKLNTYNHNYISKHAKELFNFDICIDNILN